MSIESRDHKPQSWEHLLEKDPHSGTGFRLGVVAAVFIHAGIFAVTWPTVAQTPPEAPERIVIAHVLTDVIPRQPPPPVEFTVPTFRDDATIIVPGPPEEVPTEPLVRDEPTIPINIAGPVIFDPPLPPVEAPDPPPTIVRADFEIDAPEIKSRIEPRYTEAARHAGIKGVVILELIIDTEGAVDSVKVHKGLPLGLTQNAIDAVEQWRFAPSTYNDHPVAVRYILTVTFNLA